MYTEGVDFAGDEIRSFEPKEIDDEVDKATRSLYDHLSVEDEAKRLLKEIRIAMEQVKESKFYVFQQGILQKQEE